jgi:hypothetical protein
MASMGTAVAAGHPAIFSRSSMIKGPSSNSVLGHILPSFVSSPSSVNF